MVSQRKGNSFVSYSFSFYTEDFLYFTHISNYIHLLQATLFGSSSSFISARCTRVGTLILATIYLQLIQNRYMFRSFTVLHCSHQHCVQPVASDVEVVGYL